MKKAINIGFTLMVLSTGFGAILMMGGNGMGLAFTIPGISYIVVFIK